MREAQNIIDAIHGAYGRGDKHGLRNTSMLAQTLGCGSLMEAPAPGARRPAIIHVAGTNGKGSICAMLESILRHAGYRTGLYTSPFLQAYQERVRLDGVPISDDLLVKYGSALLDAAAELEKQDVHATPFELGTGLALSAFAGEPVDFAVLEVGLGGRLDPTNVVVPDVCAIAAIGMDHMQVLGDTLEEIAGEKAGIMKPGVPVVCHPALPTVEAVFTDAAARCGAPLRLLKREALLRAECTAHGSAASYQLDSSWPNVTISLPGEHQLTNAMTVLAVVEELRKLGYAIPDEAVYTGLAAARWPARLEWCGSILIDGAHNAQGVESLLTFVKANLMDKKRVLLTGVLAEKLQPAMLTALRGLANEAVTVTPDNHRAMPAEEYAARLTACGMNATPAPSLEEGLRLAREQAGEDGIILAAGSLYFAGSLRTALGLPWQ